VLNESTTLVNEKYKLVLCSNLPSTIVAQYIAMFNLNKFFITIVHANTISVNKPHPCPIYMALNHDKGKIQSL
jgi:beta-phosphoglucomutase-like phosphatase (HAD superfamily)